MNSKWRFNPKWPNLTEKRRIARQRRIRGSDTYADKRPCPDFWVQRLRQSYSADSGCLKERYSSNRLLDSGKSYRLLDEIAGRGGVAA